MSLIVQLLYLSVKRQNRKSANLVVTVQYKTFIIEIELKLKKIRFLIMVLVWRNLYDYFVQLKLFIIKQELDDQYCVRIRAGQTTNEK